MLDYYKNSEILDNDVRKYKKLIIGSKYFFYCIMFYPNISYFSYKRHK